MSPTPWSICMLHGAPMVVDARGYTVISTVNAIESETVLHLMQTIVDGVNAAAERAKGPDLAALARVVVEEDRAARTRSQRRHVASMLLAQAVACRRCKVCGAPVADDVIPSESIDGAISLHCADCTVRIARERGARLAIVSSAS
jgi:hypothetical protein